MQAAISSASRQLPKTMLSPPTFRKVNPTDEPILFLVLSSKTLPLTTVDKYAETLAGAPAFHPDRRGAGQCLRRGRNMPCASRPIPPRWRRATSASTSWPPAIQATNVDQATGALNGPGRRPDHPYQRPADNADGFRNQIIAYRNGAPVRIGDVANVIDSVERYAPGQLVPRTSAPSRSQIKRQPGSNTIEVVDNIKKVLPQFSAIAAARNQLCTSSTTAARPSAPRSTTCRTRC